MTDRGDKDEHTDRTQRHDWDKKERARDTEGNKHGNMADLTWTMLRTKHKGECKNTGGEH